MKPNEYIRKYNLKDKSTRLDGDAFVADLAIDFASLLEYHQAHGDWRYEKFKMCVSDMRDKFDSITNKTAHPRMTEKFWGYFFATVVVPTREAMFGEELRQRREQHRRFKEQFEQTIRTARQVEEERREEVRQRFWNYQRFVEDMISALLLNSIQIVPTDSFRVLQMEAAPDEQAIKKRYHELSLEYHPDRGGDAGEFRKLVEAKNRCLAWAQQENRGGESATL
jgi:hypothetical protein